MNPMLEAELLAHLDDQIGSAQRLLRLVLDQGESIRARDVDGVLAKLAEIQTEMGRRAPARAGARPPAAGRRRRCSASPAHARDARAPVRAHHARGRPRGARALAPSCAACSARSPASTASTAR